MLINIKEPLIFEFVISNQLSIRPQLISDQLLIKAIISARIDSQDAKL